MSATDRVLKEFETPKGHYQTWEMGKEIGLLRSKLAAAEAELKEAVYLYECQREMQQAAATERDAALARVAEMEVALEKIVGCADYWKRKAIAKAALAGGKGEKE